MLMDEDTLTQVEDRTYVNPQKGLNERLQFIDTLRDVQAQNTAQINQNTYNLGSPVASNVGGLGGSEALWQAQYQTPQTNAQIADLKAVAQQTALNQAMQNLSDIYQNQYKQASRNYNKRAKSRSSSGGSTSTPYDPTQLPQGEDDLVYDGSEMVTVGKLSTEAQQSLNQVSQANQNNTAGIKLWSGYKPNLSYQENMFNYMSYLAQKNKDNK